MTTQHIPLFPLTVVLLPGMTLPLHIFEPRYKRMIKTVIDEEIPFGAHLSGWTPGHRDNWRIGLSRARGS
jgi:ATP-dependent Lon protease